MDTPDTHAPVNRVPWGATSAFLLVAVDFALITVAWPLFARYDWLGDKGRSLCFLSRVLVAGGFTAWLFFFLGARPDSIGMTLGSPRRGLRVSAASVALAAGLVAAVLAVALALKPLGYVVLPRPETGLNSRLSVEVVWLLIAYPLLEEWIYRGMLVPPLERQLGPRGALVFSGLVFQALHLSYGQPYPHYFVGGMILAWAFMMGRSLLYPLVLHAAWNLFVIVIGVLRASGQMPV